MQKIRCNCRWRPETAAFRRPAYPRGEGKKVLVLEKHNCPAAARRASGAGRTRSSRPCTSCVRWLEGRPKGAVRELLSDRYKLDVDWRAVNEAFCAIATDEGGFNVEMPVGVQAFIDEMERQVPGSRKPMTQIMEMARMVEDGVNWLAKHHNEPEGLAKVENAAQIRRPNEARPGHLRRGVLHGRPAEKAKHIFESYWTYVSADSKSMSFAVYAYMTYMYLTQMPGYLRPQP